MGRQPAKVLAPGHVLSLLAHVDHQRHPDRNRVLILLSFKAGLRACEIAGLDWTMVLTCGHAMMVSTRVVISGFDGALFAIVLGKILADSTEDDVI